MKTCYCDTDLCNGENTKSLSMIIIVILSSIFIFLAWFELQKSANYLSHVRSNSFDNSPCSLTLLDLTLNLNAKTRVVNKLFMPESSSKLSSQIKIDLEPKFHLSNSKNKDLLYNCILDKLIHSIDPWTTCSWVYRVNRLI